MRTLRTIFCFYTAAQCSATTCTTKLLRILVAELKVNMNLMDNRHQTPLQLAIALEHNEIVEVKDLELFKNGFAR